MKNKIVIMVTAPLTNRWASHFCTDEISKSFDLEYWDCSSVAYPAFKGITLDRDYVRTPASRGELKSMLRALPKDTLIVSDIHLVKQNFDFHRLIAHYFKHRVYVNFWSNGLDRLEVTKELHSSESDGKGLKHLFYQVGWIHVLAKFIRYRGGKQFWQFYSSYKYVRECEQFVQEEKYCENLYINHVITCLPHQQYSINHPDYEKYLKVKDEPRFIPNKYIVFVDEYYPYHPDFIEINPEIDCDKLAASYYQSMNRFFDLIERKYGMKVVIAAHPMADYSTNPFNGRPIYMYKTAELVRDCESVCMHHGFCVSYVVLYDKPMCFISNEAIRGSKYCSENVDGNASIMHMPVLDTDIVSEADKIFTKIPSNRRKLYIDSFFDLSVEKQNAELFTDYFNQIHEEIIKTFKK